MSRHLHRCIASTGTMFLWALFLVVLTAPYFSIHSFWGGLHWERQIYASASPRRPLGSAEGAGLSVLVTGAAGFVGMHCSLTLRKHGDGVVGLDNFNSYYDPSLKKARRALLSSHGVFVVEGDINDGRLLAKLFNVVPFTHVLHLAAQAGVRYAMENPTSYVHSSIASLVSLLEACKDADPQPAIVWASSSSVTLPSLPDTIDRRGWQDRTHREVLNTRATGQMVAKASYNAKLAAGGDNFGLRLLRKG
ncbi:hypothetical protein EJB05_03452, partial [Eragrostis curvula]